MTKKTYQLEALSCPSCCLKIEGMLKKSPGVQESEVLFNSSRVKVSFDESVVDAEEIKSKIQRLGYEVLSFK